MGFSEQLKKARISMGYTQQQVADALGLTASTYCGYETGKRQPDVAKLNQLAWVLTTTGSMGLRVRTAGQPGQTSHLVMKSWRHTADSVNGQKRQWMIW